MKYLLIIRKMKILNYIFICGGIMFLLTGCQSVKEGLTGQKKNNSDEFLVEKKNPLTMPPDYNSLPTPQNKKENSLGENQKDIESLVSGEFNKEDKKKLSENNNESIENSILEKINAK
tara:strand:+ start:248 stop:601 length:354 start_codon:yes stop_codon:yes gene_type:complete